MLTHKLILICKCMLMRSTYQGSPVSLSRAPCCVSEVVRMRVHAGFLSNVHQTGGRSCMASIKARNERLARKRRARPASADAAGPTGRSSAAHPAAAPAAGAACAAAQTADPAQVTQDVTRVVQRGRAGGDAAAARAHPAEECEAAPLPSPAARARDAAAAAATGAAPTRSAERRELAFAWVPAERGRDGGEPAAGHLRHRTATDNDVDMPNGLDALGTYDSNSESGDSPHAGGACCLSLAVLLSLRALPCPDSLCLLMAAIRVRATLQCKLFGRASGSAGGSAADPEHAAPATRAPTAKARRKADKRRAAVDDAAVSSAYDSEAPSEGRPGKRHRAAAAGAPGGDEAVVARAALGAAEAEARFAGGAIDEDDDEGDARAALRCLGVRSTDPRYEAALARERADFAKQARSL